VQQLKTLHLPQFFAFEDQGAASGKRSLWDALLNDVAIVAGFVNVGNFIFSAASDGYAAVDLNKTQRQAWFNADPRTRPPKQPDKLDLPLFSSSPDPGVILSLYTWWFGYVTQLLSFPADLFLQKKEAGSVSINKADGFYLGLWAAGVPPAVYDVVSIMVQGKLVRNSWPIIDSLQGGLAAGLGAAAIITAVLPEHDPDYNWLALVNDGLQWGNVPKVFLVYPEDPVVLGVLAFEVVIGIADSATLIGSTIWSDASLTQPQTSSSAS
jgi:hypothetical protein